MDRALYIGMSGAKQIMRSQAVNANNLANANTVGFRKDFDNFMAAPIAGSGYQSRVNVIDNGRVSDYSSGSLIQTGRDLDVAIEGDGFIAVQTTDGGEAYTRAGELRITENGILINGAGYQVLGNDGGPVAIPPADKIDIGGDGTINVLPSGQQIVNMAVVDRIKLVNPDINNLEKGPDGLFRVRDQNDLPTADSRVRIKSGFLESSNVESVNEMVKMISNARLFEAQVKIMTTVKENDNSSAKLLRMT